MSVAQWYLRVVALTLAGFGLTYLFAPQELAGAAGLQASAAGWTDIRATYGGFQLGLALFLLWSASSPHRFASGLMAAFLFGACVGGGRLFGLAVDGETSWFHSVGLAMEVGLVVSSWFLYRKLSA